MAPKDKAVRFLAGLARFTGSRYQFRHWADQRISYTEGAHYVADQGDAVWLLDEIARAQKLEIVRSEEFQIWRFRLVNGVGWLTCETTTRFVLWRKRLSGMDFPVAEIELYFVRWLIQLPAEYRRD